MTFPTPYTVEHLPVGSTSEDDDGNTVEGFGTPTSLPAYAIAPHVDEYRKGETYVDTWDVDVLMPKAAINVQDRIVFDGVTYDVVNVADWTYGFHGWQPGISVGLKKWQG